MSVSQFPPAGGGKVQRVQSFTSGGSWTAPAGVFAVEVFAVGGGGGGGGGGSDNNRNGGGGGGGAAVYRTVAVTPGTVYTVTIGAGGAGGGQATNGSTGGTTSLGSLVTAPGGGGGGHGNSGVGQAGACGGGNGTLQGPPIANATGGGGMSAPGEFWFAGGTDTNRRVAGAATHGCPGGTSRPGSITQSTNGGAGINGFAGGGGAGTYRSANYGDRWQGLGAHGGGNGAQTHLNAPTAGAVNSGGGGGGGTRYNSVTLSGANGGSGYLRLIWWQS